MLVRNKAPGAKLIVHAYAFNSQAQRMFVVEDDRMEPRRPCLVILSPCSYYIRLFLESFIDVVFPRKYGCCN